MMTVTTRDAARTAPATAAASRSQGAPPSPFRVITFNTAVGNSKVKTPQTAFVDLPFYQDLVQGRPDAPILAGQEVGPEQAARLKSLSKNGNFTVVHSALRPQQGNVLLIPKRFEVLSAKNPVFGESHARGVAEALGRWWVHGEKPNLGQLVEPRGYTEVHLRDRQSGREFTVFNTHLSLESELRVHTARELVAAVDAARRRGPVVLAGDLNVRTADMPPVKDPYQADAKVRALLSGLTDMGPREPPGRRPNIDWVLADGFDPVASRYYLGDSLQLPGFPNAESISDHYAEEDWLSFRS